jgi:hypothetical protein
VLGFFQLIDHRNGKVLHGDAALALGVDYKIIRSESKVAGALAWVKVGGCIEGTDEITTIRRTTLRLFGVVVISCVPSMS